MVGVRRVLCVELSLTRLFAALRGRRPGSGLACWVVERRKRWCSHRRDACATRLGRALALRAGGLSGRAGGLVSRGWCRWGRTRLGEPCHPGRPDCGRVGRAGKERAAEGRGVRRRWMSDRSVPPPLRGGMVLGMAFHGLRRPRRVASWPAPPVATFLRPRCGRGDRGASERGEPPALRAGGSSGRAGEEVSRRWCSWGRTRLGEPCHPGRPRCGLGRARSWRARVFRGRDASVERLGRTGRARVRVLWRLGRPVRGRGLPRDGVLDGHGVSLRLGGVCRKGRGFARARGVGRGVLGLEEAGAPAARARGSRGREARVERWGSWRRAQVGDLCHRGRPLRGREGRGGERRESRGGVVGGERRALSRRGGGAGWRMGVWRGLGLVGCSFLCR